MRNTLAIATRQDVRCDGLWCGSDAAGGKPGLLTLVCTSNYAYGVWIRVSWSWRSLAAPFSSIIALPPPGTTHPLDARPFAFTCIIKTVFKTFHTMQFWHKEEQCSFSGRWTQPEMILLGQLSHPRKTNVIHFLSFWDPGIHRYINSYSHVIHKVT